MNIDESVFAVKLYEMEQQYGRLQCRIRICEQGDGNKIRSELEKAEDEYMENTLMLEEKAKVCRSPAVTKLAQAQLEYREKIGGMMKDQIIQDLHCEDSTRDQDEKEAAFLYAEFAVDFATLAMQQALISALTALDRQKHMESSGCDQGRNTETDKEETK